MKCRPRHALLLTFLFEIGLLFSTTGCSQAEREKRSVAEIEKAVESAASHIAAGNAAPALEQYEKTFAQLAEHRKTFPESKAPGGGDWEAWHRGLLPRYARSLDEGLKRLQESILRGERPPDDFLVARAAHERTPHSAKEWKAPFQARFEAIDSALAERAGNKVRALSSVAVPMVREGRMFNLPADVLSSYVRSAAPLEKAVKEEVLKKWDAGSGLTLEFRNAFGPKEHAATRKTLKVVITEAHEAYVRAKSGGGEQFAVALPYRISVLLRFEDPCWDTPNTWRGKDMADSAGSITGEGVEVEFASVQLPNEVTTWQGDARAESLIEKHRAELRGMFERNLGRIPAMEFFPGGNRAELATVTLEQVAADPLRVKAFAFFRPDDFKKQFESFVAKATAAQTAQIAPALVECNYSAAAPLLLKHQPAFSAADTAALLASLKRNPAFANFEIECAWFRGSDQAMVRVAWPMLRGQFNRLGLLKDATAKVLEPQTKDRMELLAFLIRDAGSNHWLELDGLLFTGESEIAGGYFSQVASAKPDLAQKLAERHYLQVAPTVRERMLNSLLERRQPEFAKAARELETARKLVEKGDQRTADETKQLRALVPYQTVAKYLRSIAPSR